MGLIKKTLAQGLTVAEVMNAAQRAREQWLAERSNQRLVEKEVFSRLDAMFETLFLHTLGVSRAFGEWRVDKVNGRTTALTDALESAVSEVVPKLMKKHAALFTENVFTEEQALSLKKFYSEQLFYQTRTKVNELAVANAEVVAKEVLREELELTQNLLDRDIGGAELAQGE